MNELTESQNRNLMASRLEEEQSDNAVDVGSLSESGCGEVRGGWIVHDASAVLNWAPTYNL